MTDIFEGSIIRVARRLDELMQQLARAAKVSHVTGMELTA
jgi:superfamily II RNA helicase